MSYSTPAQLDLTLHVMAFLYKENIHNFTFENPDALCGYFVESC